MPRRAGPQHRRIIVAVTRAGSLRL